MREAHQPLVVREHGVPPFRTVLAHGGPGAAGELGPVARQLSATRAVLEPMQTAMTVDEQVEELRVCIESRAEPPVVLVGHSWGAWLSCIVAARYPRLVAKLILIGSAPFEPKYVPLLTENRLQRLTPSEQDELQTLSVSLGRPGADAPPGSLQRLGELGAKTDTFEPIELSEPPFDSGVPGSAIYASVWPEAARLRETGELLRLAARIDCPVVAIHGSYDPHPADGVREPLAATLRDFRMVLLERCGHDPWRERHAASAFYAILDRELSP